VVAIYATFLQRAFDQIVHDACQNDQPVLIGVDRAGLVGEDGTSHQGMFSFSAHRQIPHLVIAAPKDEQELRSLVRTALAQEHPFALSYPRDAGFGVPEHEPELLPVGRGEVLQEGTDILLIGFGPIVRRAMETAAVLAADGWSVGVINARFAKPLDRQLILDQARGRRLVVTMEESTVVGGFGAGVLEALEEARLADPAFRDVALRIIGIPGDRFVDHGSVADLRRLVRLDTPGLVGQVRETLTLLGARAGNPAGSRRSGPAPDRRDCLAGRPSWTTPRGEPRCSGPWHDRAVTRTAAPPRVARVRLDQLLVERGLADSRTRAQALLLAGRVKVGTGDGARTDRKAGDLVDPGLDVSVAAPCRTSRGAGRSWPAR